MPPVKKTICIDMMDKKCSEGYNSFIHHTEMQIKSKFDCEFNMGRFPDKGRNKISS